MAASGFLGLGFAAIAGSFAKEAAAHKDELMALGLFCIAASILFGILASMESPWISRRAGLALIGIWVILLAALVWTYWHDGFPGWLDRFSDFERGAIFGVFVAFLLAVTVRVARRFFAARVETRPVPPASSPAAPATAQESPVPMADIEWLRRGYAPWQECVHDAVSLLERLREARELWIGDGEKNAMIAILLRRLTEESSAEKNALDNALGHGRNFSKAEYRELLAAMQNLIIHSYPPLTYWIMEAGTTLLGKDRLLRGAEYAELYAAHRKALADAREARMTETFRHIAENVKHLEERLPPPLERNPRESLDQSPKELGLMARWEGRDVVVGRYWMGCLNVVNVIPPEDPARKGLPLMFVCARPGDDRASGLFYVYPEEASLDLANRIVPRMEITIAGKIADAMTEGVESRVVLSPAEFVNPGHLVFPQQEDS